MNETDTFRTGVILDRRDRQSFSGAPCPHVEFSSFSPHGIKVPLNNVLVNSFLLT